jgi:hypothetical protein
MSLPFPMGKGVTLRGQRRRRGQQIHGENRLCARPNRLAPGSGGVYTCNGGKLGRRLRSVRRRLVLQERRGDELPRRDRSSASARSRRRAPPEGRATRSSGHICATNRSSSICGNEAANANTGSAIYVGAPSGAASALTALLRPGLSLTLVKASAGDVDGSSKPPGRPSGRPSNRLGGFALQRLRLSMKPL